MGYVLAGLAFGICISVIIFSAAPPDVTPRVAELLKYRDDESAVTCYRAAYKDGISCIPDWQLKAPAVSQ